MKDSGVCPKCNSHTIIENKPIQDRGHYNGLQPLALFVFGRKTSWFHRKTIWGELRVWICGECGYTELYTTNHQELFKAHEEAQAEKRLQK